MTVNDVLSRLSLESVCVPCPDREITGVYAGDLLSWVMGHAEYGECLVTIMSNVNVLAVASLLDLSCVILAEGVTADEEFTKLAQEKNINVLSCKHSTYDMCTLLYEALK